MAAEYAGGGSLAAGSSVVGSDASECVEAVGCVRLVDELSCCDASAHNSSASVALSWSPSPSSLSTS